MMGRLNHEQEQFFYSFRLDDAVPVDHLFGGSPRYSIWAGFIPNWRPITQRLAVLRSTRC